VDLDLPILFFLSSSFSSFHFEFKRERDGLVVLGSGGWAEREIQRKR
jgi:hypothetical protein